MRRMGAWGVYNNTFLQRWGSRARLLVEGAAVCDFCQQHIGRPVVVIPVEQVRLHRNTGCYRALSFISWALSLHPQNFIQANSPALCNEARSEAMRLHSGCFARVARLLELAGCEKGASDAGAGAA